MRTAKYSAVPKNPRSYHQTIITQFVIAWHVIWLERRCFAKQSVLRTYTFYTRRYHLNILILFLQMNKYPQSRLRTYAT